MEITDNLGICFSIKERNLMGMGLILPLSPMERARVWSMRLECNGVRRECRTCSGVSLGPQSFALWTDTGSNLVRFFEETGFSTH